VAGVGGVCVPPEPEEGPEPHPVKNKERHTNPKAVRGTELSFIRNPKYSQLRRKPLWKFLVGQNVKYNSWVRQRP
jgi:hypothetical protein